MHEPELRRDLAAAFGGAWQLRALGASAFCETWKARREQQKLFVKVASGPGGAMLEAEAEGLRALAEVGAIRVPKVHLLVHHGAARVLALDWLDLVPPDRDFGARFGRALAALHAERVEPARYGWPRDNFIGATPQVNTPATDWVQFVAQSRLGAMRDRLGGGGELVDAVDAVIARLPKLLDHGDPPRPSLVHGDLWQGNWGMLADGAPVIFDPAVSWSDAEAELAMMDLFGSVPSGFEEAYTERSGRRPEDGRKRVYQLYHLLNHAVLFGGGYVQQALRCARGLA